MKRLLLLFVSLLLLLQCRTNLHAGILYLSHDSNANGLFTLNTANGRAVGVGSGVTTVNNETVGLTPSNIPGTLFGSRPFGLLHVNAGGSGATQFGSGGIEGLALNEDTGIMYGAINGSFFTVDPNTGARTGDLARPGGDVEGLAYARDGDTIFGLASGGLLRRYSIANNTWTTIGHTGVNFDQIGLAYDPELNLLYAVGQQNTNLYSIDPNNATASVLGDTGLVDPGGGLAFVPDPPFIPPGLYLSQDGNGSGLFRLDTMTGAATVVGPGITTVNNETNGLSPGIRPGTLFGSRPFGLLHIHGDGGGAARVGNIGIEGLALNEDTGILYGAINGSFFTVNPDTGVRTSDLARPGGDVEGLAYGRDGDTIFGLASGGLLRRYSIANNTWTTIGNTGVNFDQIGLAYDPGQDVLYAVGQQNSNLYRIDADSAFTMVVGSTGLTDPGGGLAFIAPEPAVVPEPGSLLLFAFGAVILFAASARRWVALA